MSRVPAPSLSSSLALAAARLYMNPEAFLNAFNKDGAQALAALIANPERFGKLRTYVGPISLKANITRLKRLAKQIVG